MLISVTIKKQNNCKHFIHNLILCVLFSGHEYFHVSGVRHRVLPHNAVGVLWSWTRPWDPGLSPVVCLHHILCQRHPLPGCRDSRRVRGSQHQEGTEDPPHVRGVRVPESQPSLLSGWSQSGPDETAGARILSTDDDAKSADGHAFVSRMDHS